MTFTPGAFARTGLLVLFAVVIQISGFQATPILGGTIDLIPLVVAAIAIYAGSVAGVSFLLEIGTSVSLLVLREAVITVLLNVAIALPFFALVRRVLRPVLAVDPLQRMRRRSQPTEAGPLGLRGLEVNR